jgi:hypothetical protein
MSAMFPLPTWIAGITQPNVPVNDAMLRTEVLHRGATSITATPPASPADGQVHIVGASPTGVWSTFAANDVVLWRSGTWYRFAPFLGWLKQVGSEVRRFDGTAWVVVNVGGGGAIPIQDEGTEVVSAPTAINFVGSGVSVTNAGGVAVVNVPGPGTLQGAPWRGFVRPRPNSTILDLCGLPSPDQFGTSGQQNLTTASVARSLPHRSASAAAATNAIAGFQMQGSGLPFFRGPSARIGGFDLEMITSPGTGATISSHRYFMGLIGSASSPTDQNPSSLLNIIGIGYDSADSNLQLMHNDGTGTATKVNLGASFPKPSLADERVYRIKLVAVPGQTSISWSVTDLASGAQAVGSASTDIPSVTQGLTYLAYMSAGGTSTGIRLDFNGLDVLIPA